MVRIKLLRAGYTVYVQQSLVGVPASNGAAEAIVREVVGLAQSFYFQMLET